MFVSADYLAINYGVHDTIANFFVDREPPANNLYWHKKLLYLRHEPGYLFIPVMVDTLYRLGISRDILLGNEYIDLLEQIGHIAALQETEQITYAEAIKQCIVLTQHRAVNKFFYHALVNYMEDESENFIAPMCTPFPALHRGDIFLFSVAILNFDDATAIKIVEYWFALIGSFLLLDDAEDVENDKLTNDENAFLQSGLDKIGIEKIKQLLSKNLTTLKSFNKPLARVIDNQFIKMAELPHIHQYLNQ
jgi:hypothetical protein